MTRLLVTILVAGFGAGCAENLAPVRPDADPSVDTPPPLGKVTTTRDADGSYTTLIDSTSTSEWTHGDFETGEEAAETGPWDLRFQRFHISTNGGESGTGGVEVAPLPGMTFAQVTAAPATGWISDAPDGDDANLDPDYAFEQGDGWYDYDVMTHVLTAKPLVWAVKTGDGAVLKLEIKKYYDDAGTAGWFTLHWAPL